MIVKVMEAAGVAGGLAVMLCDDNGVMLPMQISTTVENGVGEFPIVTATFHIDGEVNRLVK